MEEQLKKIFKFLHSERLSENERISMRNVLRSVIRENPVRESPMFGGYIERFVSIISIFERRRLRTVSFAFALVLVVGAGTSYAAEQALPGETLYAIKVNISEPIQGVLAVSDVARVQWDTELLSRRLEEAATLAAQGDLNDATRDQIESQIARKAEDVNVNVEKLRSSAEGVVAAAALQSDLEASLVGHENVLTALSIELPQEATMIAPLLNKVRIQAQASNDKRKSTELAVTSKREIDVRNAAATQKKTARTKVNELRTLTTAKRLQASTSAEASSSALQMEQAIDTADQNLEAGNYVEAFSTYQAAIRAAKAVEVNLDAEVRLSTDLGTGAGSH